MLGLYRSWEHSCWRTVGFFSGILYHCRKLLSRENDGLAIMRCTHSQSFLVLFLRQHASFGKRIMSLRAESLLLWNSPTHRALIRHRLPLVALRPKVVAYWMLLSLLSDTCVCDDGQSMDNQMTAVPARTLNACISSSTIRHLKYLPDLGGAIS